MARYYRRGYRRYRRGGGRYWRRNWWRRGTTSSQKSGTRRFNISIPVEGYGSVAVNGGESKSFSFAFEPFYNSQPPATSLEKYYIYGNVVQSNLFATYCSLYDEVKLNSCSVQLAVTGLPENKQAVKIVSSVDRHCNLDDLRTYRSGDWISGSAESDTRMFTSLMNAKMFRYFRARDMQERTVFVDSTGGTRIYSPSQGVTYNTAGLVEFLDTGSLYGAFNPIIYYCFYLGAAPVSAGTVSFQYRVVWNLTFRNPKFGTQGGSAKGVDMKSVEDDVEGADSELDEETIKKLKALLHEDVQLPLSEEDTRMSMDDGEEDDKEKKGS